ncbi:putative galactokinase-like protein [Trypanosoma conorhini]|uniref:Putative galactokinase-like protein n=1 Tax=Trypanosoma conorhini TaxID=83891 RepID=A0A422NXV2_9TRYP|nr:putative galactokinase-like protein [Trypanosoma conorhini]RNF10261.1 putative galactokinase-like protein [Trypanosoma conorhini]
MYPTSYTDGRLDSTLGQLRPLFKKAFGVQGECDVEWILFTFAPGRVNFIGEHVDYMGGYVCPAAVGDGCHILVGRVKHFTDDKLRFATTLGEFFELDSLGASQHDKAWTTFIRGAVSIRLAHHGVKLGAAPLKGLCMMILGTLEMGAGMSASASFGIALLNALSTTITGRYKHPRLPPGRRYSVLPRESPHDMIELVKQGRRIETDFCGAQVGIMDQFVSAFAVANKFLVLDCTALTYKLCDITPVTGDDACFLLIDSMLKHDLMGKTAGTYNTVRSDQEHAQEKISKHALGGGSFTFTELVRDPTKYASDGNAVRFMKSCQKHLSRREFDRAYYNVTEQIRTREFIALTDTSTGLSHEERFREAGRILNETHEGLKTLLKVSTEELDFIHEIINKNSDVAGGRMMGGGFGGCIILLLKKRAVDEVVREVREKFKARFGVVNKVYPVVMGDGAFVVSLAADNKRGSSL